MALKQNLTDYIYTDMLNINNYSGMNYVINGCKVSAIGGTLEVLVSAGEIYLNNEVIDIEEQTLLLEEFDENTFVNIRISDFGEVWYVSGDNITPPDYNPDGFVSLARLYYKDEINEGNIVDLRKFGFERDFYDAGEFKLTDGLINPGSNWLLITTMMFDEGISIKSVFFYLNSKNNVFTNTVFEDEFTIEGGENGTISDDSQYPYNIDYGYYYCGDEEGIYINTDIISKINEVEFTEGEEYNKKFLIPSFVKLFVDLYEPLPEGTNLKYQLSLNNGIDWSSETKIGEIYNFYNLPSTNELIIKLKLYTDGVNTPKIKGWELKTL